MSALNGEDEDKLFKKPVKFLIKNLHTNDSRNAELLLSLEWLSKAPSMQRKDLVVSVADENDPFFLYVLNLDNEEFNRLKQQQGLLVDYISFPQSFMDLLELCIQEENNSHPRYALNLTLDPKSKNGSALLEIVEVNRFKMITHLSLRLCMPSDSQLKQYLAECFKKIKGERDAAKIHHLAVEQQFTQRLQSYRENLKSKVEELAALRKEMKCELEKSEHRHHEQLQTERQKLIAMCEDEKRKIEKELKSKELNNRKEVKEFEARAVAADNAVKELNEKMARLERSKSDLHSRVKSLEKESKELKKHLEVFELQNEGLVAEVKQAEAKIETIELKCRNLQEENDAKEEEISRLRNDLEAVEAEKFRMVEGFQQMEAVLDETRRAESGLRSDIAKANDIIRKMQAEAKISHEKLKARSILASQLEQLVREKDIHIKNLEKDISHLQSAIRECGEEISRLIASNRELKNELSECKKQLSDEENVLRHPADQQWNFSEPDSAEAQSADANGNEARQRSSIPVPCNAALDAKYLQRNYGPNTAEVAAGDGASGEDIPRSGPPLSVRPKRSFQSRVSRGSKISSAAVQQQQKPVHTNSRNNLPPRR